MVFKPKNTGGRSLRKYKNLHEKKADDIKRSLIRRSNMRRKYFKMLEQEGEVVPKKASEREQKDEKENSEDEERKGNDNESGNDSENEGDFFEENNTQKQDKSKSSQKSVATSSKSQDRKPMTHADRLKLIKERKKSQREEYQEKQRNRVKEREEKENLRQKHKQQMNQFTRKGQPKMGPRINKLLDQIKDL